MNADPAKGGQRIATVLMYLTNVEEVRLKETAAGGGGVGGQHHRCHCRPTSFLCRLVWARPVGGGDLNRRICASGILCCIPPSPPRPSPLPFSLQGGETVFPSTALKPHAGDASYSACGQMGVAAKPRRGDALLFFSLTPEGHEDTLSLHAGCPVIKVRLMLMAIALFRLKADLADGPTSLQSAPHQSEGRQVPLECFLA